jgi:catechol 2,3-dioxygenase-like lactoylglutathione lyase family enzyme
MTSLKKARAIGFNHVALEVGDIDEALAFYGRLFDFKLRSKDAESAFIDLGDQFIAFRRADVKLPMTAGTSAWWSTTRLPCAMRWPRKAFRRCRGHFSTSRSMGQPDEIVSYDNVQFSKAPNVLRGMGLGHLAKNQTAIRELADKGMAPEFVDEDRR